MTQPAVLALISGLLLYLLLLMVGRWLKRSGGVRLGVLYQCFALVLAGFIPLTFLSVSVEIMQALAAALTILGTLFGLALLRRFFWEYYFEKRHGLPVPKFMRQLVGMVVVLVSVILVLGAIYGLRIPGLLAGSGIVAVILGFALQDLLGNVIAGFALNLGQPFKAGDWLVLDKFEGEVIETNWRSTRLCTNDSVVLDIPNNLIARQTIINLGNPAGQHSMRMHVRIDIAAPPNQVKGVLLRAARQADGVLSEPAPRIYLSRFEESSILYEVKFALKDHQRFNEIADSIKTNIWYGLQRAGIRIPFPVRTVQLERKAGGSAAAEQKLTALLGELPLFEHLDGDQRARVASRARSYRFGRGERIIQQGEDGDSMFILIHGQANVFVENGGEPARVATLRENDCFGEMSLLTGERRSATVVAVADCEVVSIDKDSMAKLLQETPDLMKQLSELLATRRLQTESALHNLEPHHQDQRRRQYAEGFLRRVRSFFEL